MTGSSVIEKKRIQRNEAILDAAVNLMVTQGFSAMTMDDVANEVGISKATLYQHFRSKEELAVSTVLRIISEFMDYMRSINTAENPLPSIERLRKVLRWILDKRFSGSCPDFRDAEATMIPLLKRHPEFLKKDKMFFELVVQLIDDAKAEGYIAPHLSTLILAHSLQACIKEASYDDLLREGKCTIDDLEETLVWMLTCGASEQG